LALDARPWRRVPLTKPRIHSSFELIRADALT
jgi:hypothetical protein